MTTTVNITDYCAGDSLQIDFTVEQSDGTVFPNLDTATIVWSLHQVAPLGAGKLLLSKTTVGSGGVTVVSAQAGTVSVDINEGEIEPLGAMLHKLVVTTAGGDVYTVAKGQITANHLS
jgi:hypothetical protein